MNIFSRWIISALSLYLAAQIVPGFVIVSFWAALWVALLLGFLNVVVKPVLVLLTLPVNIVTLGVFTFVINALILLLVATAIKGFEVAGFSAAFWAAVVLWLIGMLINIAFGSSEVAK